MAFGQDDDGDYPGKPVEEGKTYEVEIDDLGSKGDGIARVEGFVVFVPDTDIGERVEVEINSVGRKFAFGEVTERLGEVEETDAEDLEEDAEETDEAEALEEADEDGDEEADEDVFDEEPDDDLEEDDLEDDFEDEEGMFEEEPVEEDEALEEDEELEEDLDLEEEETL